MAFSHLNNFSYLVSTRRCERWKKLGKVSHDKLFYADVIPSFKFIISTSKKSEGKQKHTKFNNERRREKIIFNFAHSENCEIYDKLLFSVNIFAGVC